METRTYNGVTYQRSRPDQPWQRVGGTIIPKSETTTRKEGADADKATADAAAATGAAPYAGPTAAANVNKTIADTVSTNRQNALPNLAPGQSKLDEEYSKRYAEWQLGGSQDARRNLEQLRGILGRLDKENLTGPIVGRLPEMFAPQDVTDAREQVEEVVQRNLRTILGAQFTEKEGERLIARAYNPRLDEKVNKQRLERLINQMEAAADANDAAASYFEKNGTLQGFEGELWRGNSFDPERATVTPEGMRPLPQPAGKLADAAGGGTFRVPGLEGLGAEVFQMVKAGVPADEIIRHAEQRALAAGRPGVPENQAAWIREIVEKNRANPDMKFNPAKLEFEEKPSEGGSFLGSIASGNSVLGEFGKDLSAGAMSAANAVTAGNLANLAGNGASDVLATAREDSPWSSFGGDIVGNSIAMANIENLGAKAGLSFLSRAGGLGGDLIYGGVRGASETEGGIEDKIWGAFKGTGAAGLGNLGGQFIVAPTIRAAGNTRAGRTVADLLADSGTIAGNMYRGARGEAPLPYQGANIPRPLSTAERVIARNLGEDADPVVAALTAGRSIDMPVVLADTSPRLRNLGAAAYRRSDLDTQEGIERFLAGRSRGQSGRAQNQIEASFGPLDDPVQASQALMQNAGRSAAPLYDEFRSLPARTSPEIEAMLQTPAGQQALARARTIAGNEQIDPNAIGFDLDAQGNTILTSSPSPQSIDLVKRGFDDVLEQYRDPITGRLNLDEAGRAIEGLRQRYLGEADRLYPQYGAARAAYAGPASENAALLSGQQMVGKHPRQVGQRMDGMSDAQLEQFRLGQRSAMADAVQGAKTSTNPYEKIWGDPLDQERAALVFGAPAADRFNQAYDVERAMAETNRGFLGGSPTQARQALDDQLSGQIGEQIGNALVDTAVTGVPARAAMNFAQRFLSNRAGLGFAGARERASSEIAQLLASEQPVDRVAELLIDAANNRRYIDDLRARYGSLGASLAMGGLGAAQ